MKAQQVDYLNIGLMIIALVLAINLPFKLFLFSYAILGPLHYLTEIGWLKKHNYFTKQKSDYYLLVLLCLLVTLGVLIAESSRWPATIEFAKRLENSFAWPLLNFIRTWQSGFVFVAFITAFSITVFNEWKYRILLILVAFVLSIFVYKMPFYLILFGIFMPTIFHVSLFTGAFMLYGALKAKHFSGYLSFGIFILCMLSFFFINFDSTALNLSNYIKESYIKSNFHFVNDALMKIFSFEETAERFSFNSALAIRVQAFIAFAYTYHYLNWFSKTSIIQWHKVPKQWIVISGLIWIASIALYSYDYRIGLIGLFFLSMLHVFLEFPLNHRTFIFIGNKILRRSK